MTPTAADMYAAQMVAHIADHTDATTGTVVMALLCEAMDHRDVGETDRGNALARAAVTLASDWKAHLIAEQERQAQ